MRLIDADVAVENIEEWLNSVGTALIGKGLSYTGELMGCIEDAPTIDAAPVQHGRWIEHDDGVFTCSQCGNAESIKSYFCGYCGTKMDLEG